MLYTYYHPVNYEALHHITKTSNEIHGIFDYIEKENDKV